LRIIVAVATTAEPNNAFLFGSGYGFGGAFAKQVAAFAVGIAYPNEVLPLASLTNPPPRRDIAETLGVRTASIPADSRSHRRSSIS